MVDLPEPERPVSHTVQPFWPSSRSRAVRETWPTCQVMFFDLGSLMLFLVLAWALCRLAAVPAGGEE